MKDDMNIYIICSVIILLSFSSIPILGPTDANFPSEVVWIRLVNQKITVRHENSTNTSVDVEGNVFLDITIPEDIETISLNISVNSSVFSFQSLPTLAFDRKSRDQDFNFSMIVPYNTPADEEFAVTVEGHFLNYNNSTDGQIYPSSFLVFIQQSHSFSISNIESSSIKAGDSRSFKVNISNNGNGPDRYSIFIPHLDDLIDDGWEIIIHGHKGQIPPGKHHIETIKIEVPFDEKPGKYEIEFVLISTIAESLGNSFEKINGTIHINVLNNFEDEIISALWIGTPVFIIVLFIIGFIIIMRRIKR